MLDKNLLCLSVLNGQVKAAAFRKGQILAQWEGPNANSNYSNVGELLKEAVAATGSTASQISLVLAHPQMSHQVIEVPHVKGSTLMRVLDRQAQKLKAFQWDAAWSWQPALPIKKIEAVLLNLCPKTVLDQLSQCAQQNHLQLVRVLPTTSVLIGQLKSLPLQKDEIVLLAAETGLTTTLVIGRKDGRICLGRVLLLNWKTSAPQVAAELSRSIGFAEQQSGLTVSRILLFGESAPAQLPLLQEQLKRPIELSPVECIPHYWLEQAGKLPEKGDGNLISLTAREAPKREKFLTLTAWLVIFVVLVALGTAAVAEMMRRREVEAIQKASVQIERLTLEKTDLEKSYAKLEQMREMVRVVSAEKLPAVPSWFLSYLGEAVPEDLVLTQMQILRTNQLWSLRLKGFGQTPDLMPAFLSLSNNLVTGPFHLQMIRCEGQSLSPVEAPKPVLSRLVKNAAPEPPLSRGDVGLNQFIIEGLMQ